MFGIEPRAPSRASRIAAACFVASFALLSTAGAHESRPLFIEIAEENDGAVSLRAVTPASIDSANLPSVTLGPPCALTAERRRAARTLEADYDCGSVTGAALTIVWPAFNPSVTALIRMTFANGETRTASLPPDQSTWTLPEPRSFGGVAKSYFVIGVEHIAGGADHLLFLAGLLVIAGTFRRAIVTATGFTIAHSLTLALVALDIIRVSVPAVEAVIALSIVFLGAEIARGDRTTLSRRRPAIVASFFGLAHGAGFAAALSEIGLPATEKISALFFFNAGVEAGQIAIVLAVFGAIRAGAAVLRDAAIKAAPQAEGLLHPDERRAAVRHQGWATGGQRRHLELACGYALGVVSAYWFVERAAAIFAA